VEEARRKAEEERQQREEQRRREDAKLAEVRARAEQARKMAEDQMDIERIRRELEAKTQAFSDAQRAAGIDVDDAGNDDAGNDDGSDSAPEVRYPFFFIPCIPYSSHWIHLLGDPTEEQETSEGRGPQTDASGYLRNCESLMASVTV
jgi:hypothetical protein